MKLSKKVGLWWSEENENGWRGILKPEKENMKKTLIAMADEKIVENHNRGEETNQLDSLLI